MTPPELTGDDPVVDVFHPIDQIVLEPVRYEMNFLIRLLLGQDLFGQRLHLDKPLGGQARFDLNAGTFRVADTVDDGFDRQQVAFLLQVSHNRLARLETVQALILAAIFIDGSIVIHDVDPFQVMPIADLKVVRVVGRSDFHRTSPKLHVNVMIGNDGDFPTD